VCVCVCCIVTEYFMHFFTSGSIYLWSDDSTCTNSRHKV